MEEGDTSVANSVTVQLGIVISHKGNADSQADEKQEKEGDVSPNGTSINLSIQNRPI